MARSLTDDVGMGILTHAESTDGVQLPTDGRSKCVHVVVTSGYVVISLRCAPLVT